MEPLSATVAAIVTGFLTKGAAALGQQVGEAAADAARMLAQAVLDRLKADPAEQRTVERYEADPEALEPAVEAAIDDAMAKDEAFAAQLEQLVASFREAAGPRAVTIIGNVGGSVVVGDRNQVIDRSSGTISMNSDPNDT
jgi:hypothetical protein